MSDDLEKGFETDIHIYCSHYDIAEFRNVSVNNMQSLSASQTIIPIFKFQRTLLHNSIHFASFAAFFCRRSYVIAVDYDRYVILEFCCFESNKPKAVQVNILHIRHSDLYQALRTFPKRE